MELTAGVCDAQFSEEGKEWRFPKAQAEGRGKEEEDDDDEEEEEKEEAAAEEEAPNAGEAGKNSQKTAYRD